MVRCFLLVRLLPVSLSCDALSAFGKLRIKGLHNYVGVHELWRQWVAVVGSSQGSQLTRNDKGLRSYFSQCSVDDFDVIG